MHELIGRAHDEQRARVSGLGPPRRDRRAVARDQHALRTGADADTTRALGQGQSDHAGVGTWRVG